MALASNALITAEEYYSLLGKASDKPTQNTERIETFINAASTGLEADLGRKFVPQSSIEEKRNGDGESNLFVNNLPLTLTAIHHWDGSSWYEWTSGSYARDTDSETGEIWFTGGHIFSEGHKNYKVAYIYGYARSDVPADLKRLCFQITQRMLKLADGLEGRTSESAGDVNINYDLRDWTPDMYRTASRYRRVIVG